jgi:hypothetical protein
VLPYAEREHATSFDAPGARYTHRDGLCSFEVLIEAYDLRGDPALVLLARVVHGADVSEDIEATPESAGLLAIADGFALLEVDDQRHRARLPVYDALYAGRSTVVGPAGGQCLTLVRARRRRCAAAGPATRAAPRRPGPGPDSQSRSALPLSWASSSRARRSDRVNRQGSA